MRSINGSNRFCTGAAIAAPGWGFLGLAYEWIFVIAHETVYSPPGVEGGGGEVAVRRAAHHRGWQLEVSRPERWRP